MSARDPDSAPETPDRASPDPAKPDATLLQVIGAVFWSFLGIRKGGAMRRDMVTLRPQQVIIVGVLIAALFVATLLVVVRLIVAAAH